jgi:FkbM family methyltransferase
MAAVRIYELELKLPEALPDIVWKGLQKGWYERDEVEIIRRFLKSGDRVLEMGAGLGVTTMVAARIVGAEAVRTFEANPCLIPLFRENAARNGLDINIRNAVLWPESTRAGRNEIGLAADGAFWAASVMTEAGAASTQVPVESFEAACARHAANVLIMDIEGFEIDIFEQCDLAAFDRIIVEIHYRVAGRERTDRAIRGLQERGFRLDLEVSSRGVLHLERV